MELWIGCIAGALEESDYRAKLQKAGFEAIDVEPTRVYGGESARERLAARRAGRRGHRGRGGQVHQRLHSRPQAVGVTRRLATSA